MEESAQTKITNSQSNSLSCHSQCHTEACRTLLMSLASVKLSQSRIARQFLPALVQYFAHVNTLKNATGLWFTCGSYLFLVSIAWRLAVAMKSLSAASTAALPLKSLACAGDACIRYRNLLQDWVYQRHGGMRPKTYSMIISKSDEFKILIANARKCAIPPSA